MQIVIIGAGKVGYSLARMLSSDEHDVIVVEPDIERGNIINEKLDVQVVNGNGASPRLQRAYRDRECRSGGSGDGPRRDQHAFLYVC